MHYFKSVDGYLYCEAVTLGAFAKRRTPFTLQQRTFASISQVDAAFADMKRLSMLFRQIRSNVAILKRWRLGAAPPSLSGGDCTERMRGHRREKIVYRSR
jgi:hypothetical protein